MKNRKKQAFSLILMLVTALPNFLQAAASLPEEALAKTSSSVETEAQEEQEQRSQTANIQTILTERSVKKLLENGLLQNSDFASRQAFQKAAFNKPNIEGSEAQENLILINHHLDIPSNFQPTIDGISRAYFFHFKEFLPEWLSNDFTGISVQDLIHNNMIPSLGLGESREPLLDLSNRYINDLTGLSTVQDINLAKSLKLDNNRIIIINPHAFTGLANLTRLYLKNNRITTINRSSFTGLANGTVNHLIIFLNNNKIAAITPGAFSDLARLWFLNLNMNQIADDEISRIKDEVRKAAPRASVVF